MASVTTLQTPDAINNFCYYCVIFYSILVKFDIIISSKYKCIPKSREKELVDIVMIVKERNSSCENYVTNDLDAINNIRRYLFISTLSTDYK